MRTSREIQWTEWQEVINNDPNDPVGRGTVGYKFLIDGLEKFKDAKIGDPVVFIEVQDLNEDLDIEDIKIVTSPGVAKIVEDI